MSRIMLLATLTAALAGCVVSAAPVVDEEHAIFEPRLLGTWESLSNGDRAVVGRGEGRSYVIEVFDSDDERRGLFNGHVGNLGGRLVLDLTPAPRPGVISKTYEGFLITGHILYAIELRGPDEVRIAYLEGNVLGPALQAGRVGLSYDTTAEQLILHGTTRELREGLGEFLAEPDAFAEPDTWRRVDGGVGTTLRRSGSSIAG